MGVDIYAEKGKESFHITSGRFGITDGSDSKLEELAEELKEEVTEIQFRIGYNRTEINYKTFMEEMADLLSTHREWLIVRQLQKLREEGWNIRVDQ